MGMLVRSRQRFDLVGIDGGHHVFEEEDVVGLEGAGDALHRDAIPAEVAFDADLHLIADGVADLFAPGFKPFSISAGVMRWPKLRSLN